jgi:histidine decarboxylase
MNAFIPLRVAASEHTVDVRLADVELRMQRAHATHLGYPYNLSGLDTVPASLCQYLINNLGDPYVGSHYASEVCDLEREAVQWLMNLWGCEKQGYYWGSIGASGTEGNFWGLYLAREAFPAAKLIYSREAHYSIPKAAKILRMETICVACGPGGAIDLEAFSATLHALKSETVIVALTCGTTVKGAHDDIGGIMNRLADAGFDQDRRYVHVDGALNAMVLPFAEGTPPTIIPSFQHGIDSLSTSGHKMIGTPMPCGVLVARAEHVSRIASAIAYLRSSDTTLMGSRNGHAVLAIWSRLFGHGESGYRTDVKNCLARAEWLASILQEAGVPVLRNPVSLTVMFPQPNERIVRVYQLACNDGMAHAIMMPNVTQQLADRFATDYLEWWMENPCITAGQST